MQCPFCKEEIQDGAIKCKHCQSMLNGSSETKSLLGQIGPFSKWLLTGIFALSILAFFFTNFRMTFPIVGEIGASMYDVVKITNQSDNQQTTISGETAENKPDIKDITDNMYEDAKNKGKSILPFIFMGIAVLGIALHYIFTIIWGICTFALRRTFRSVNMAWLALAVQFPILFAIGGKIIISDLKSEMLKEVGSDNPFAALGNAMMSSFSIEPGIIMWILMIMAIIGLAIQFMHKEKVSISSTVNYGIKEAEEVNKQNPIQNKKKWITISIIAGSIILIVVVLKIFGLIPGFNSGLDANRGKDNQVMMSGQAVPAPPPAPEVAPADALQANAELIKQFSIECIDGKKSDAIKQGGMSQEEATEFAKSTCAEMQKEFVECMEIIAEAKFDDCFKAVYKPSD